jgi:hypothetical protein
MQGFFVHVSNGTYPVSGSLGFSNAMRTTDLNPIYKAATIDNRPIMKFTASFDYATAATDKFVLYFDNYSTKNFDPETDALKLMNTDIAVPNLYEIVGNSQKLSISGIPEPADSLTKIPLGINALKEGWIIISATDLSKLPSEYTLYLEDKSNNIRQDLRRTPTYRFYASSGETNNRFNLIMAIVSDNYSNADPDKLFTLSKMNETLQVRSNLFPGDVGELRITNMTGQTLFRKTITSNQTFEVGSSEWKSGIYVVTLVSGNNSYSEKTIIRK